MDPNSNSGNSNSNAYRGSADNTREVKQSGIKMKQVQVL